MIFQNDLEPVLIGFEAIIKFTKNKLNLTYHIFLKQVGFAKK